MAETVMPVAEAAVDTELEINKQGSYELAFHVLPTVAEGEVTRVVEAIRAQIEKLEGEVTGGEAPQQVDLAYSMVKRIDSKNRSFDSAYFGWVRFKARPEAVLKLKSLLESDQEILRHLLVKLTRLEEANPFYYHEALKSQKPVVTIDERTGEEVIKDDEPVKSPTVPETDAEVDDTELDRALEKPEV